MDNIGSRFDFCPVCGETFLVEQLNEHVNSHFPSPTPSPSRAVVEIPIEVDATEDAAVSLGKLPIEAAALIQVQTVEPQFIPKRDSLAPLEGVYTSGRPLNNGRSVLCVSGPVQHFCSAAEDKGWGCGYRNCQMLISHLLMCDRRFEDALFGGAHYVPDIVSLQAWLEAAWKLGYDPEGKHSLDGSVQGSTKWVGAVDIAAMLRSFGIRVQFVDFVSRSSSHHPDYQGGTVHDQFSCDLCKTCPIIGVRYSSRGVPNFDVCEHCVHDPEAEMCAPYTMYGRQETHTQSRCSQCGIVPIVGVKYRHVKNWRQVLCSICYRSRSELEQSTFKIHFKAKPNERQWSNHDKLCSWVWRYFTDDRRIDEDVGNVFVRTDKAPLYLQHQGHSRTIVGIERVTTFGRNGSENFNLIIFDSTSPTSSIQRSFERGVGWQRLLKRGVHTLHNPEYQILYVEDGLASSEEERETFKSIRPIEKLFS